MKPQVLFGYAILAVLVGDSHQIDIPSHYSINKQFSKYGDPINLGPLSIVMIDGKWYAQAFTAVFAPTPVNPDQPVEKQYKDFYQENGNVHIVDNDKYLWIGLGEVPHRQLRFAYNYGKQSGSFPMIYKVNIELNPLLEAINDISTERGPQPGPEHVDISGVNVDQKTGSNQFGLLKKIYEKLPMRDLTTYVYDKGGIDNYLLGQGYSPDQITTRKQRMNVIKSFKDLREEFGLSTNTPRGYHDILERDNKALLSCTKKLDDLIHAKENGHSVSDVIKKFSRTDRDMFAGASLETLRGWRADFDYILKDRNPFIRRESGVWRDIIIQIGSEHAVKKAVDNLKKRYDAEGKNVLLFTDSDDTLTLSKNTIGNGPDGRPFEINGKTRVTFVGHSIFSGEGNMNSQKPLIDNIAKQVKNLIGTNTELGKIRFVTCNPMSDNFDNINSIMSYFMKQLPSDLQTKVVIPLGYIQVDKDGRKLYGMSGNQGEMAWQYRDSAILVKQEGKSIKYGMLNTNPLTGEIKKGIIWQDNIPDTTNNRYKLIYVSETGKKNPKTYGRDLESILARHDQRIRDIQVPDDVIAGASGLLNSEAVPGAHDTVFSIMNGLENDISFSIANEHITKLYQDSNVQKSIGTNDAVLFKGQLELAHQELSTLIPPNETWVPLLNTAVEDTNGVMEMQVFNPETNEGIEMQVFNPETKELRTVYMSNTALSPFKNLNKIVLWPTSDLKFSRKKFVRNRVFGMVGLIQLFHYGAERLRSDRMCRNNNNTCPAFAQLNGFQKALQVYSIYGLVEGAFGTTIDGIEAATEIYKRIRFKEATKAALEYVSFSKRTFKAFNIINKIDRFAGYFGVGGSAVGIGLSIAELVKANTTDEKIERGIDLAFSVIGWVASAASEFGPLSEVVAEITGIVAAFGSIITSLVFEFKATAKKAELVGEYFFAIDNAYKVGGINSTILRQDVLQFLPHAIVQKIDLVNGRIELDSQYIYRTEHSCAYYRSSCSGYSNYFFWYKDFPKVDRSKHRAINIREELQYSSIKRIHGHILTLILPTLPKSFISYKYSRLPGSTTRYDKGFNVLRQLERDYRFDYDFYIVPAEQIVSSISNEYVETTVSIVLQKSTKSIYLMDAPLTMQGFYDFEIKATNNAIVMLILGDNKACFTLSTQTATKWIVNTENMPNDNIVFFRPASKTVTIGNYTFTMAPGYASLSVMDKHGGYKELNFDTSTVVYRSFEFNENYNSESFKLHLASLNVQSFGGQEFVTISDYHEDGVYLGTVFYEVRTKKLLYSDLKTATVNDTFKRQTQILGKENNYVFFMSSFANRTLVWWSYADNHTVGTSYEFFCGKQTFNLIRRDFHDGILYMIQSIFNVTLIYALKPHSLTLISVEGSHNDLTLAHACFSPLKSYFDAPRSENLKFPGSCTYATTVSVLPVRVTHEDQLTQYIWLQMNTSSVSSVEHEHGFCNFHPNPPTASSAIMPNIPEACAEISLWDIAVDNSDDEIYFFVCNESYAYYQVNVNIAEKIIVPDGFEQMQFIHSTKYIKSKSGALYLFDGQGNVTLSAVSKVFLKRVHNWKFGIKQLLNTASTAESRILLFDIYTQDGKEMNLWYDCGEDRISVVSPALSGSDIDYIGETQSDQFMWLHDRKNARLILQSNLPDADIGSLIKYDATKDILEWMSSSTPKARVILSNVKRLTYNDGDVLVITHDGLLLSLNHLFPATLVGVTNEWVRTVHGAVFEDLKSLCSSYKSTGLITLSSMTLNASITYHSWYHCFFNIVITIATDPKVSPISLGLTVDLTFLFSLQDDLLEVPFDYSFSGVEVSNFNGTDFVVNHKTIKSQKVKNGFLFPNVYGSVFDVKIKKNSYISSIPLLEGITTLVIGVSENTILNMTKSVLAHYSDIVVASCSYTLEKSAVFIDAPHPCAYHMMEYENTTTFHDSNTQQTLSFFGFNSIGSHSSNDPVLAAYICGKDPLLFSNSFGNILAKYLGKPPLPSPSLEELIFLMLIVIGVVMFNALAITVVCYRKSKTPRTREDDATNQLQYTDRSEDHVDKDTSTPLAINESTL